MDRVHGQAAEFRFDLPGTLNFHTAAFMMDPAVKRALHLEASPAKAWPGPGEPEPHRR